MLELLLGSTNAERVLNIYSGRILGRGGEKVNTFLYESTI